MRDDGDAIYRATDPATRDELSFDCSYNTLELSFGPDEDVNAMHRRFIAQWWIPCATSPAIEGSRGFPSRIVA